MRSSLNGAHHIVWLGITRSWLARQHFAESLLLAETGNAAGAIQIAGTARPEQLPFFVAACDFTLMGEELYAASSYLSHEPLLLGGLKGQDFVKIVLVIIILIGTILVTFDIGNWYINLFDVP